MRFFSNTFLLYTKTIPNSFSWKENLQNYLKKILNMEKNTLFSIFTIGIRKKIRFYYVQKLCQTEVFFIKSL